MSGEAVPAGGAGGAPGLGAGGDLRPNTLAPARTEWHTAERKLCVEVLKHVIITHQSPQAHKRNLDNHQPSNKLRQLRLSHLF